MNEWRDVPGHGFYQVNSKGDVRRSKDGRPVKPYKMRDGYLKYGLYLGSKGKYRTISGHRLVALAFLGPSPSPDHVVAHNDGRTDNNHWSNLRWATVKENQADRKKHGTHLQGASHPRRRLTQEAVNDIRQRFEAGEKSIRELARIHDMSRLQISKIVRRLSWLDS